MISCDVSVVLGVQGVEEKAVNDRPLVLCGSDLQQRRSAQLHTAGFVSWRRVSVKISVQRLSSS